jgi:hypothetical protein
MTDQTELFKSVKTVVFSSGPELDALFARARRGEIFIPIIDRENENGVWRVTYKEKHGQN